MAHIDKGHFAAKHPAGTTVAPALAEAIVRRMTGKTITCSTAHAIAQEQGVSPREAGVAIDLQEGQIQKCQLGLFGYGKGRKAIVPAESVTPDLQSAIEAALVDGRLPCAAAWHIADTTGMPRMAVANACEKLGIRINRCQLGAF
ncbi:hypothetical protein [Desulfatitalea alkaliphila]|uniref:Uncharacterized protein n=1 Tax=Desulfatitalea alkaliphila TaxID=2929485 RepID=A0AA41UMK7_9BACT|nr:hypothetical protein [Desulfatitalea alkaliphila]MCJ8502711.1 hypothetical protein [Desulfatitalea alkaliphila]